MRHIFIKSTTAVLMLMGLTACAGDLNISSIDPQSSTSYEPMGLLAKQYATLGLTGQKGAAGNGDISSDEGESGFYRTTFNLMELPSDECLWAWTTDTDIPQIQYIKWNSSSPRVQWAYQRLGYDITQYNYYLTETSNATDEATLGYRAEVRFLRALHYWYFLDLFHKAPFKNTFDIYELPVEKVGKELYDWIDQELTEIEPLMADVAAYNNSNDFGRADRGAAYLLHARLALNSEVYTNGAVKDYQKAIDYCNLLDGKYQLSKTAKNGYSGYAQVFMADNDENAQAMKEIILPIRQDGLTARCYSGANYLVSSTRIAGMPFAGTSNCWSCNFARPSLVQKFFPTLSDCPVSTEKAPDGATEKEINDLDTKDGTSTKQIIAKAGDDRAMFYAGRGGGVRKLESDIIAGFLSGISIVKWQNIRSDGGHTHDIEFPDTDIPLLRYAEMYLIRAEANFRLNGNVANEQTRRDMNELRSRANASTFTNITDITETTIIDEWCREFYMEGRRRSDLIRFDSFAGDKYIWSWKNGKKEGSAVDKHFNLYPIPLDDTNNNPNMHQNKGY